MRALAPASSEYVVERDAAFLSRMTQVSDQASDLLANVATMREEVAATGAGVDKLVMRETQRRQEYSTSYRRAVRDALITLKSWVLSLTAQGAKRNFRSHIYP